MKVGKDILVFKCMLKGYFVTTFTEGLSLTRIARTASLHEQLAVLVDAESDKLLGPLFEIFGHASVLEHVTLDFSHVEAPPAIEDSLPVLFRIKVDGRPFDPLVVRAQVGNLHGSPLTLLAGGSTLFTGVSADRLTPVRAEDYETLAYQMDQLIDR